MSKELYNKFILTKEAGNIIYDGIEFGRDEIDRRILEISKILTADIVNLSQEAVAISCNKKINFFFLFLVVNCCDGVVMPVYARTPENKLQHICERYDINYMVSDHEINLVGYSLIYHGSVFSEEYFIYECNKSFPKHEELKGIELLMLSSGTTGVSKAISLSLDNILSNTRSIQKYIIPTREDRCLIIKEITHSSSLISELINSLLSKNSVLLSDLIPTVSSLGYLISTYGVTILYTIPDFLLFMNSIKFINNYRQLLGKLRLVQVVGAFCPPNYITDFHKNWPKIDLFNGYGLTEASPRVAVLGGEELYANPRCVGYPISGVGVHIDTSSNNTQEGEICVTGPNIMVEYYLNEELTSKIKIGGMLRTGDIGYFDDKNRLYILGRKDNRYIKSGKNIFPEEIESVVRKLPFISEVIVYPKIESGRLISILEYTIFNDEEKDLNQEASEIIKLCKDNLEDYKIPDQYRKVKNIPHTSTGKVKRDRNNYYNE